MTLLVDRVNHLDNCIVPSGAILTLSEAKRSHQAQSTTLYLRSIIGCQYIVRLSLSLIVANINWLSAVNITISHLRKSSLVFPLLRSD